MSVHQDPGYIQITPQLLQLNAARNLAIANHKKNRLSCEALNDDLSKTNEIICKTISAALEERFSKIGGGHYADNQRPEKLLAETTPNSGKLNPHIERAINLKKIPMSAPDILRIAREHISQRAQQRDAENGERSMSKTVSAFNEIFGHEITEAQGWQFMALLKIVRGSQGDFHRDDYEDQAAYAALAGECASKPQQKNETP